MKPKNIYRITKGTLVYITINVLKPSDGKVIDNLPVICDPAMSTGCWRLTRSVMFTEDDRTGHAGGMYIELFKLPNRVNDMLILPSMLSLYLVASKDAVIVIEKSNHA